MAKRLQENLSSIYLGAAQRLKPKASRIKIVAYVESYDDIFFWRSVLDDFEDEQHYFEVMLPSSTTLGKGKKLALMNQLGLQLGQYMIACVDADYDYLLQDTTHTSHFVNRNPYVFHTYVYAIENYQCYAKTLHRVCVMATLNDRQIIDFEAFMREYSLIVWPLFVWNVWAYRNEAYREFTMSDFGVHVAMRDVNVYHPERSLDELRRRVNKKIGWLQHHFPQAKSGFERLKQELQALGLTPDTTYFFMQGHMLMDNVVLPLVETVCVLLRKEREREILSLSGHEVQRQNELSCYQHSQQSPSDMMRRATGFKSARPYAWLTADLQRLMQYINHEHNAMLDARHDATT